MQDSRAHARGWFLKAESDLTAARRLLDTEGPYDTVCFHAQQAVEKLLKSFLAFKDQPFPRTHNLEELVTLCEAVAPGLELAQMDLTVLTPYAIQIRYDFEFWPDSETASDALQLALKVRQVIVAALPSEARP